MITILLTAVLVSMLLDCLQTLDIKNHPHLHEVNVVLGPHPKDWKVVVYFLIVSAVIAGLSFTPPASEGAVFFLPALLLLEVIVIINNHKLGLRI